MTMPEVKNRATITVQRYGLIGGREIADDEYIVAIDDQPRSLGVVSNVDVIEPARGEFGHVVSEPNE